MVRRVLIAGGLCGTTMLVAAEKIREACGKYGTDVDTTIQNLWETSYVRPGYDLIVEMFPYFKNMACPVLSGKPFINHVGEKDLLNRIAEELAVKEEAV